MANLINVFKPVIIAFLTSRQVKELVCDLIDRYVETTDNDIDDLLAETVRRALLKDDSVEA
jgi:hypothetical protein